MEDKIHHARVTKKLEHDGSLSLMHQTKRIMKHTFLSCFCVQDTKQSPILDWTSTESYSFGPVKADVLDKGRANFSEILAANIFMNIYIRYLNITELILRSISMMYDSFGFYGCTLKTLKVKTVF